MREIGGGVALVTGGARRLGRAFAEGLAGRGMRIAVHYAAAEGAARELVGALRSRGCDAEMFGADLRDAAAAAELPDRVAGHFGRLDVLV
ncbi:MAG: SDR family NAD(P)-dependent oxidoreductase, partial [Gemmatimonadales bacterium]